VRSDSVLADDHANGNDEERAKGGNRHDALLTISPKRNCKEQRKSAHNSYANQIQQSTNVAGKYNCDQRSNESNSCADEDRHGIGKAFHAHTLRPIFGECHDNWRKQAIALHWVKLMGA
jgi:hypothetical protein